MKSTSQILLSTSTAFYLFSSPLIAMDGEATDTEWEEGRSIIPVKSDSVITELDDALIDKRVLKAKKGKAIEEAEIVSLPQGDAIKVKASELGKALIKYDIGAFRRCSSVTVKYKMRPKGVDFTIFALGDGEKLPLKNHGGALNKILSPGTLARNGFIVFEPQGRERLELIVGIGENVMHPSYMEPEILIYDMDVTGIYKPILQTSAEDTSATEGTSALVAAEPVAAGSSWIRSTVSASISTVSSTVRSMAHWTSLVLLGTPAATPDKVINGSGTSSLSSPRVDMDNHKNQEVSVQSGVVTKELGEGLVLKEGPLQVKEGKGSYKTTAYQYSTGAIKIGRSDASKDYNVRYDLSEFRDADIIRFSYTMQTQETPLEIFVLGDSALFPFEDFLRVEQGWGHLKLSMQPSTTAQKGTLRFYPKRLEKLEFVVAKFAKTGDTPAKSLGETVVHDMHIRAYYNPTTKKSEEEGPASMEAAVEKSPLRCSDLSLLKSLH